MRRADLDILEYTADEIEHLIDQRIHKVRDRGILKDLFIHGYTYEKIAERNDTSCTTVKKVVGESGEYLLKFIKIKTP